MPFLKQKIPFISIIFGIILVFYSILAYDPTVSTSDPSICEAYSETSDALSCLSRQLKKAMDGERVVNIYRLQTQNRIFYGGLFFIFIGFTGIFIDRRKN
jgi:hypothetical protein